ncbi:cyd operon YbgE family protein [Oceanospirillum beijerinckii]|uniref:cyd operon YbgE family protein n=1 Tax=Oceanospirillum beijerinckii TaxID=64976 RepID=UPI0003FC2753|nr:cyd operon YbgE family protein [Oceanospirillum beijerinckii]
MKRAFPVIPYPESGWSRFISLLSAVIISGVITLYPEIIATDVHQINHNLFSLFMLAISAGFIHGVGFVPGYPLWRLLFHPLISWGVILYALFYYLL